MGILKELFKRRTTVELALAESSEELTLAQNYFAVQTAISLIAANLANCEFQTLYAGKCIKEDEYYLWNIRPNNKQTKVEFLTKIVSKLVWNNECLIVELPGGLYVADSFSRKSYALYPDTFTNVVVGDLTLTRAFSEDDVLHMTLNDQNITALLNGLLAGYKRLLSMAMAKYKRAGGRKGVVSSGLIPQNDEAWNKALADLYGERFKTYFTEENALVVLPKGQEYTEISGEGSKKSTSDVVDIINLKDEVYTEVGRAFRIHPSLLKGNLADVSGAMEYTLTYAVKPFAELLQNEIIAKRYGAKEYKRGSYLFINTSRIRYIDPFAVAEKADKLLADSVYNADEIRVRFGDVPLNTKASQEYIRTKNYESVDGGEKNES